MSQRGLGSHQPGGGPSKGPGLGLRSCGAAAHSVYCWMQWFRGEDAASGEGSLRESPQGVLGPKDSPRRVQAPGLAPPGPGLCWLQRQLALATVNLGKLPTPFPALFHSECVFGGTGGGRGRPGLGSALKETRFGRLPSRGDI